MQDWSTDHAQGLLEAAPDAIVVVTEDGLITLINAQAQRLFGYRRQELIGRHIEILVPESARHDHPRHRQEYVHAARPRPMGAGAELAARRKDGSEFPAEISLSAIRTPEGLLIAAAIRDATGRRHAAEAQARLASIVLSSQDAIVGQTIDGVITSWNPSAERIYGYGADEAIGRSIIMLIPPDRVDETRDLMRRVAGGERVDRFRTRRVRKDGTEIAMGINFSPIIDDKDTIVGIASISRDLSGEELAEAERERLIALAERERIEARLQQSQRLESLGQLAGGVAHDFNNLLAVVLNYIAFIAEEVGDAAAEDAPRWDPVLKDINQIQRAAERAISLTHQLLAFGRREVVKPRVLNLNTVVREVESLLQRTIGEHVRLETSLSEELWPIRADPGQLTQVLVNLAVNARDAMPGGGSLTIGTDNVTVDESYLAGRPGLQPGTYVRLQVSDTGGGMPKDVADRAFEPFFTTKPKGEATGLGLSTVYGTITQTGGQLSIYSELGVGTTISALVPASDESVPVEERPAEPDAGAAGNGETVLVVEDEDAMREVTERILTRNGYRVMTAPGGDHALEVARSHDGAIHLLLSDVIMPKMLGKEVADRVTALRPDTRVLFMSGYARPVLTENGTLGDDVTLVSKPFSERGLLQAVRSVLDQ
ncbi:PAS domain S-box protein [Catenuloplanes sp. NPDC051500]|uniref:PAS domain S-box protein n=1 Tax=Catenuloplanes sp. NPDC051500 TaxID=3363959 RepID=UPI003794B6CD